MARTINKEDHAAKRREILDAAQRLVYVKGYERMTIQDIRDELGMSNGAFFHYFESKPAVLEALIEQGQETLEAPFRAIVDDPNLSAVEKLQRFFTMIDQARYAQRTLLADLVRIWFADENAIVREKSDAVIVERRAPLLNAIVRQGVAEGVFTTPYPDQAGVVILAITRGMGNALLKLLVAFEDGQDAQRRIHEIVMTAAASAEAIERVLGVATPMLYRPDAETVKLWLAAL